MADAKRERSTSIVIEALPKTLKLLCQTFEKHVKALNNKYALCEKNPIEKIEDRKREAELFLESLKVIVARVGTRIKSAPAKLTRLGPNSDLQQKLVLSIRGLIPTGWLWSTWPMLAQRHVNILEQILLHNGVNKWNWVLGKDKRTFVPVIFEALAMNKGTPIPENADMIRLISTLLKAGASSEPFTKEAMVSRAEQCTWVSVMELLNNEDKQQLEKVRKVSVEEEPTASGMSPLTEEKAPAVIVQEDKTVDVDNTDDKPMETKAPQEPVKFAMEVSAAQLELEEKIKLQRKKSEQALKLAELKLKEIQETREAAEKENDQTLARLSVAIQLDDGVDSDDEDYVQPDPEDLIQQEMLRLRDEARQSANDGRNVTVGGGGGGGGGDGGDGDDVTAVTEETMTANTDTTDTTTTNDTTTTTDNSTTDNTTTTDTTTTDATTTNDDEGADSDIDVYDTEDEDDEGLHHSNRPSLEARLSAAICDWDDTKHEESDVNETLVHLVKAMDTKAYFERVVLHADGSSLMQAVRAGKVGAAAVLIYGGALSSRTRESKGTPELFLHQLAQQKDLPSSSVEAMIEVLVCGGVYINEIDEQGRTPMDVALEVDNMVCLNLLENYDGVGKIDL